MRNHPLDALPSIDSLNESVETVSPKPKPAIPNANPALQMIAASMGNGYAFDYTDESKEAMARILYTLTLSVGKQPSKQYIINKALSAFALFLNQSSEHLSAYMEPLKSRQRITHKDVEHYLDLFWKEYTRES